MSCSYDSDYNGYLDDYGNPCYPDENQYGGGGGNYPGPVNYPTPGGNIWTGGGVPPSITITPQSTQIASTNLDKWLKSISEWTALLTHQSSIPTPGAAANQIRYPTATGYPVGVASAGGNLGGNVGASLQKFFSSTTGLLVIGAAVLLYMKPPGRR